jgi:hypothetical protein
MGGGRDRRSFFPPFFSRSPHAVVAGGQRKGFSAAGPVAAPGRARPPSRGADLHVHVCAWRAGQWLARVWTAVGAARRIEAAAAAAHTTWAPECWRAGRFFFSPSALSPPYTHAHALFYLSPCSEIDQGGHACPGRRVGGRGSEGESRGMACALGAGEDSGQCVAAQKLRSFLRSGGFRGRTHAHARGVCGGLYALALDLAKARALSVRGARGDER